MTDRQHHAELQSSEDWHVVENSHDSQRRLARSARHARYRTPPAGLETGAEYREWVFQVIDRFTGNDTSEHERRDLAIWRSSVEDATADQLWSEYQEARRGRPERE